MTPIEERIEIFKTLTSPNILRVINLLVSYKECNVTDISMVVDSIAQTGISRFLRKLRTLGLAQFRKSGNSHYYSLTEKGRIIFARYLEDIFQEDEFQHDLQKFEKVS